ncbi:MAG: sortase [Clostridia bacterium]|nr:sortase [Clostridia bacterium]
MRKKRKKKGQRLICAGILLIVAAAVWSAYNIYEGIRAGSAAHASIHHLEAMLAADTEKTQRNPAPASAAPSAWEEAAKEAAAADEPAGRETADEETADEETADEETTDEENAEEARAAGESALQDAAQDAALEETAAERPAEEATETAAPTEADIPAGEASTTTRPETGSEDALPSERVKREELEIPDYILNPNMEMPVSSYDGQDYIGILEIPAIDLKMPVISEWRYSSLKIAPCRYTGSAYTRDMVICGHNYATHFGYLNRLYTGATVVFTDIDGNRFQYVVEAKETLDAYDIEGMVDSGWDLSLFTCTPGGKYRLTIRCTQRNMPGYR